MPLIRTSLGFFLLASGAACGYAFLRPYEPLSGSRIARQAATLPSEGEQIRSWPIFPARSLELDVERTGGATNGTSPGEPKVLAPDPPKSTGTQDLALALQTELAR